MCGLMGMSYQFSKAPAAASPLACGQVRSSIRILAYSKYTYGFVVKISDFTPVNCFIHFSLSVIRDSFLCIQEEATCKRAWKGERQLGCVKQSVCSLAGSMFCSLHVSVFMDSGAPGSTDSRPTLCSGVSRMTKDEWKSCKIPRDLGLSKMKKWKHEVGERSAWATLTHFAEISFQEIRAGG